MKTFRQIVQQLSMVYPEGEARALASWLCEEQLKLSQTDLLLDKDNHLSADNLDLVKNIVSRLLRHEPIQYVLGYTDFCCHRFHTAPGALIPRPETEELVHHVVDSAQKTDRHLQILDIGTGTGCIALSLALALPQADVTGWDISDKALAIAQGNAARYPEAHVNFEQADILHPIDDERQWDFIVSNPPYVRKSEATVMQHNVLDYEPHLALFVPDDDPLLFYQAIARYAQGHLSAEGEIWVELNEALSRETADSIEKYGFPVSNIFEDGNGKKRFLSAKRIIP